MRVRTKDQEQVQGKARPLSNETFQGENRQNLPSLSALLLPYRRMQFHRQGQASLVKALHGQTRDPGEVPTRSLGRKGHFFHPRRVGEAKIKHRFQPCKSQEITYSDHHRR